MCLLGGGETRRIYREASIPGTVTLYQSEGEEERRMANTADLGAGGRGSRHYKWPWDRGRFVRHQNAPLDVERVSTTKATFFFCQFAHALVRFSLGNRVTAPPCHVTSRHASHGYLGHLPGHPRRRRGPSSPAVLVHYSLSPQISTPLAAILALTELIRRSNGILLRYGIAFLAVTLFPSGNHV